MCAASRQLLHDALDHARRTWPDHVALRSGTQQTTFLELDAAANQFAAALRRRGLARGDRVAIFMQNSIECAIAIYGTLKAGGVFVLIDPQTKQQRLIRILEDCTPQQFLVDDGLETAARHAAAESVNTLILTSTAEALDAHVNVARGQLHDVPPDTTPKQQLTRTAQTDLAALIYTSGSTGAPKGVMQTHQSMVFVLRSVIEYLRLDHSDIILNVLPLAFDYGLYQLLMSVEIGATLVLERSFAYAAKAFGHIVEHGVTVFPGVPTLFTMLKRRHARQALSFPSVRRITNTAAPLSKGHVAVLREIFPNALIFAMYGLTECKRVSFLEPSLLDSKPTSVGRAIPGTEVFLLTPSGRQPSANEPGILHVRGPHVMQGYWRRPEETAEVLRDGPIPGEKILYTGDWFRLDEDGYLYFVGRSDEIIKIRGEKVSPAEIESALLDITGVEEVAVTPITDELLGHAFRVHVVPSALGKLDERSLRHALAQRIESVKMPREIIIVKALPKLPNGKIAYKELV